MPELHGNLLETEVETLVYRYDGSQLLKFGSLNLGFVDDDVTTASANPCIRRPSSPQIVKSNRHTALRWWG